MNIPSVPIEVRTSTDASERAMLQRLDGAAATPDDAGSATTWVACTAGPTGRVQASLCCVQRIGLDQPRAWYRMGWAVHAAAELRLFRQQRTLLLGNDLTGADELNAFAIASDVPAAQAQVLWTALAQAALHNLAQAAPQPLADASAPAASTTRTPCVAELPGAQDARGHSPFWLGLGRHFHDVDLTAARLAHGPRFDSAVASLLPRHLLYASFLPASAQSAMAGCSSAALPLRAALLGLGFRWRDHITVTDGGAVLERDAG